MKKKLWIILLLSLCLASNALAVTVSDGTTADGETYIALENDESAVDVSGTANAVITNADIQKNPEMLRVRMLPAFGA